MTTIFHTLSDGLNKLEIAVRQGRITADQYRSGADYLASRIESIRSKLDQPTATRTTLIRGASIATNAAYREVARIFADGILTFEGAALAVASVHSQAGTNYGDAVARAARELAENGEPTNVITLAN